MCIIAIKTIEFPRGKYYELKYFPKLTAKAIEEKIKIIAIPIPMTISKMKLIFSFNFSTVFIVVNLLFSLISTC